jgi:hypothetical protein
MTWRLAVVRLHYRHGGGLRQRDLDWRRKGVWRGAHCRLRRNREAGKVGDEGGNALIKGAQQGDRGGEWAVRGSMWRRRLSGGRIRPMCRQSGRPGR